MKRIFTSLLVILVALFGVSATALATVYSPTQTTVIKANGTGSGDYSNTNGESNFYDAEATFWLCTQANISGGNLNNQNGAYGGSYAVITKFDLSEALSGMTVQKATLSFKSVCTVSSKNSNVIVSSIGTDWDATTVTWNSMDKAATQISEGTGTNVKTSTVTLSEEVTTLLADDADKIIAFAIYTYTAREQKISDISLEVEAVDASSAAKVKIVYVDGENNELKKDSVLASAGSTLTLTEAQKAAFFANDIKYFYVSDNSAEVTVAGDGTSVVTVVCRVAATYNFTLNSNNGVVTSGTGFEGEKVYAPYPRYQLKDNVFYEASATSKEYRKPIDLTTDNATAEVTYTAKEGVNAIFFAEAENLKGVTATTTGNLPVRGSNAAGATAEGDVKVTTLAPGKYKFHIGVFTSKSAYADLFLKFAIGADSLTAALASVNLSEFASEEFTLVKMTAVTFSGANSSADAQFDYIWIEKTGDMPFDPATAIENADFASMEGWTENVSGGFRDFGNGLIGTYRVRTDDFIPAATVDETHLATEYCIGLEARWEGNFASYNQDVMLPAGNYKLTFDVENVNAGTTSTNYNNLFKVTNGETVYVDESTEWMNGKSGWTSHAIRFILTEDATVNISLGYGTGSNNFGHANTPALYVSHLALGTFDPLVDFKEIALKEVDALPTGDALFLYPVDAVNTAKAAIETAATVDDINAAVATAKAAQNKPAADKAYTFELRLGGKTPLYMALAEGGITIAEEATPLKFVAVEGADGQYNLTNEDGTLFVGLAGGNAWSMSTLADQKAAWTFTPLPDGAYRINNLVTAGRFVGTNAADKAAGSTCYADKQTSNGNVDWLIAEYVAPVVEPIYIETDLTAQFNSLATTKWTGSSGQVGWAAPTVTTNSGLNVAAWEKYDGSCDWTGDIMSSSVTGLTPGTYKIELYGAAAFTFGRGFGSTAFTGDFTKDTSEAYSENDAITENTGVTLFAETAEGKVSKEIPIWYATNFNTSGIATATLENVIVGTDGTIKIGLSKTSTSTNWHVVQLKGVTAQVDAVELHATTLAAAQTALNAEENAIVTGVERDSLAAAITENTTVAEQTADAYKTAIAALNKAISEFTGAKAAYQSLIDAKAYLVDLPYADAAKKPVVETATSATDATAKAEALMVALRAYYESNAMAEGVEGAQILTDSIMNPNAQDGINFWTIVKGEGSGGNIDIKNNEPWTDAAGVAEHNYFDGGDWGAQAWDVALEQKIALPAGKFLLTTIARAEKAVDFTLYAGTDSVKIPAISSVGGLFNRGWNNASVEFEMAEADSIVIGVRGVTAEIHNWMSFADFRLVQIEKPVVVEPIEGISYSWESPAGKPIEWGGTIAYVNGNGERLNYKNGDYYTICLNGKKANINDSIASDNAGKMVITLDKAVAEGDTIAYTAYITKNESKKASPYILFENGAAVEGEAFSDEANIDATFNGVPTLKYSVVPAEAAGSKTITLTRSQTGTNLFITKLQIIEKKVATGINTLKTTFENGTIYNMNGQKVNKAQKGLYIINGKKVVIK